MSAVAVATAYLEGRLPMLWASVLLLRFVGSESQIWKDAKGVNGPFPAVYAARDEAERIGFFEHNEEQWLPEVRDKKRAEVAEAEARLAAKFRLACQTVVDYAASGNKV